MGELLGAVIASLVGAVIGSLITAIFLRAALKWVAGQDALYGRSYVTCLLGGLVANGLPLLLSAGLGIAMRDAEEAALAAATLTVQLIMIPVAFLIMSAFIARRHELEFAKAMLVTLVIMLLCVALAVVIGAIVTGLMFAIG